MYVYVFREYMCTQFIYIRSAQALPYRMNSISSRILKINRRIKEINSRIDDTNDEHDDYDDTDAVGLRLREAK